VALTWMKSSSERLLVILALNFMVLPRQHCLTSASKCYTFFRSPQCSRLTLPPALSTARTRFHMPHFRRPISAWGHQRAASSPPSSCPYKRLHPFPSSYKKASILLQKLLNILHSMNITKTIAQITSAFFVFNPDIYIHIYMQI
jgi:hypothetical protein